MNRQRKPNTAYIKAVRSMTKADIESLRQPSARVRIAKLRDSHHIMARLFVSGLSNNEVAAETGYSVSRVAVLKNSPAMTDLIARYRSQADDGWKKSQDQYYDYVLEAGKKTWRKIIEKLDADDENEVTEIPIRDLMKIADSSADRVGYHRKSTKENINVNFAAKLESAIARSREVRIIDHES